MREGLKSPGSPDARSTHIRDSSGTTNSRSAKGVSYLPDGTSVREQTANWLDIDRVQILVNGRQPASYDFRRSTHPGMFHDGTVKFDAAVRVELRYDAHLIVVATSEASDLSKGWGRSWESLMKPLAFTNPIHVDVDGAGFVPNGDTLGYPLLTAKRAEIGK